MKNIKVAVIGGGASGMMAAIIAARNGAKVDIWERNDRLGKKILATGNGKCNFANRDLKTCCYNGQDLDVPMKVLSVFGVKETEVFFHELGMLIRAKDSLLYPYSEQASSVLDVLRFEISDLGIRVLYEELVTSIKLLSDGKYKVVSRENNYVYDRIILTCGGKASPKTGSDGIGYEIATSLGHKKTSLCPGLVGLKVFNKDFKTISGVRCQAKITLKIENEDVAVERGELQLTDYGVSGIAIFQLSRIAGMALLQGKKVAVSIDVCPDTDLQSLKLLLQRKKLQYENRTLDAFLSGFINKKLGIYLTKNVKLNTNMFMKEIKVEKIYEFASLCKNWTLPVIETNSYDQAQVTAGGLIFQQIDENLQSKVHKGLYFAGEILDVDGKCGGYNLQWAWSSGYVAGLAASRD